MKGKILLLVGVGIGYVLGTRAGREQYDKMKAAVDKFWHDPRVQKQVDAVEDFVKDKAPEVAEFVSDNAKTLVNKVSGKAPAPKKKPTTGTSTRSTSTSSS